MITDLTEDQEKRILDTLKRIRKGLADAPNHPFSEPSHIFDPEAQDGRKN